MAMPLPLPTFTTEDLRSFPNDGQRYELLEGMLLVTPAPGTAHQIVVGRLVAELHAFLATEEKAHVVSPGEIEVAPRTLLDPDILVFPASYRPGTKWTGIRERWLAVEVFSPSSRLYDREYKRPAYLSLGVDEVWLVDLDERSVFVTRRGADGEVRQVDRLMWRPNAMEAALTIDLRALFRDLP